MDNSKDIVRFEIPEDINREQLFGTPDANIKQVERLQARQSYAMTGFLLKERRT